MQNCIDLNGMPNENIRRNKLIRKITKIYKRETTPMGLIALKSIYRHAFCRIFIVNTKANNNVKDPNAP